MRYNTAVGVIRKIQDSSFKPVSELVSSRNPFGYPTSERGKKTRNKGDYVLVSSKGTGYVNPKTLEAGEDLVGKYNVMVSRIVYEHAGEPDKEGKLRVLSKIQILKPDEVCTDSYLAIGSFETEEEADNLASYLKTKIARFLIAQTLSSINLSKEKFCFVPQVDWKTPIRDDEIYERYGLNDKETSFIEAMIHPFERGE